jgi:predicted amidohydrolase
VSALRVTLVQQPLLWGDAEGNRRHFAGLLSGLAGSTDLVVLPETFTTGFSMEVERLAEPADGPSLQWLREQAAALGAAVTGSVITRADGHYYNRLLWVTPDGQARHYDKRHLFRMAGEHQHFTPGHEAWSIPWRGLRVCPLVCYDLRFPVYSRRRAELDYDLLVYVANWPAPRADAWRALLPARAIENQSYVVGVNRVGLDGKDIAYSGDSVALDFRGRALAQSGAAAGTTTVEISAEPLQAFREKFPAHLDADRFHLDL